MELSMVSVVPFMQIEAFFFFNLSTVDTHVTGVQHSDFTSLHIMLLSPQA